MKKLTAGIMAACTLTLGLFAADLFARACTLTPNLGLCKGARGEAEWDVFLNSNFDIIDAQVLNTGATAQTKTGPLTLTNTTPLTFNSTAFAVGDVLFLGSGNILSRSSSLRWIASQLEVGIARLTATGNLIIFGFNMATGAGAGKVLTSDGSGNGTWQTVGGVSSGWTPNSGVVSTTIVTDVVAIGTANTSEKLTVAGGIKIANSLTAQEGVIRWNGAHFQGHTGAAWVDLDYSAASGGGWTDAGTSVGLTTSTDVLHVGGIAYPTYKAAITAEATLNGLGVVTNATGSSAPNTFYGEAYWNTSGIPAGFLLSVTDAASNAASLLMNLMVGGTPKFSVRKDGFTYAAGGIQSTTGLFSGALSAASITLTTGASAGYVLTSDGSGNASWAASGAGSGVPSGMIAIFDTSCPVGWTSVSGGNSALAGVFPLGGATYGATGGSAAHTHAVDPAGFSTDSGGTHGHTVPMGTFTTDFNNNYETASQATLDKNVSDDQHTHSVTIADRTISTSGAHTHFVDVPSTTSGSGSNVPPYITVVYCKKN